MTKLDCFSILIEELVGKGWDAYISYYDNGTPVIEIVNPNYQNEGETLLDVLHKYAQRSKISRLELQ